MKKKISALLAALLLLALCGCGKPDFAPGVVAGQTYESAFLGIACAVPADWSYLTEAELREISGMDQGGEADEAVTAHDYLLAGGQVQDMYAMTPDGLQTVCITVSRLSDEERKAGVDMAAFADGCAGEVKSLYSARGITDVATERRTVSFLGEECEAVYATAAYTDVPLYTLQLCMQREDYLCVVGLTSYVEDNTPTLLKYFRQPVVVEE